MPEEEFSTPITKEIFLKEIGLKADEFTDLMDKFSDFEDELNTAQHAAIERTLPTWVQAAQSLGPDVTPERLREIVKELLGGEDLAGGKGAFFGGNIVRFSRNP